MVAGWILWQRTAGGDDWVEEPSQQTLLAICAPRVCKEAGKQPRGVPPRPREGERGHVRALGGVVCMPSILLVYARGGGG